MLQRSLSGRNSFSLCLLFFLGILSGFASGRGNLSAEETPAPKRIYSTLYDSAEHPDRSRYYVTPPTWNTFSNQTQFICLRSFPDDPKAAGDLIDRYQANGLGRIIWPNWRTIYFKNLSQIADEIKKRDLFLFDVWGYVPGNGAYEPGKPGEWLQFRVPPETSKMLEEKLGDHWLGLDNGEQDGRFIGAFASQQFPITSDRQAAANQFQRHFEQLGDDLGHRLATLVSLNFGHYYLKEGTYSLIGAETAQALPNSQVYYSWIRGAGKQYGVLWFGNASVFNRWGWKASTPSANGQAGPTKGTSLNLLKRLMFSQILYDSAAVGFENGWFAGEKLAPIGKIQQSASQWLQTNGMPGAMMTPTAVLTDFECGWSFPRHLYSGWTYRVWGTIPYESGDYLTNDVMDLLYPGYQDSSYFHDETGFLTPTPFGDSADNLLSDAPLWLLVRYPLIVAAGDLKGRLETKTKLISYLQQGGRLVMTAGNLAAFGEMAGVSVGAIQNQKTAEIRFGDGSSVQEKAPFDAYVLNLPENAKILARTGDVPLAAEVTCGKGTLVVMASPWGLASECAAPGPIANKVDEHLVNPWPLTALARKALERELNRTVLFTVGEGLGFIVCRKEKGLFTIGIFNNDFHQKPFKIESRIGKIESIRELPVDVSERTAVGFLPEGFEKTDCGTHSETVMAGADVRIFEVRVSEENVTEIPWNAPDANPTGRFLTLRGPGSVKEQILARPTFFQHYDGVIIDWKYVHERTPEALEKEAKWLARHQVRAVVDFTSGMNLFPDLRLIKNDLPEYEKSLRVIRETIEKSTLLHAESVIIRGHRTAESADFPTQEALANMRESFVSLAQFTKTKGLKLVVRVSRQYPRNAAEMKQIMEADSEKNILFAPTFQKLQEVLSALPAEERPQKVAFVELGGSLQDPANETVWTENAPLFQSIPMDGAWESLRQNSSLPLIFDSVYGNQDEEFRDLLFLREKTK